MGQTRLISHRLFVLKALPRCGALPSMDVRLGTLQPLVDKT